MRLFHLIAENLPGKGESPPAIQPQVVVPSTKATGRRRGLFSPPLSFNSNNDWYGGAAGGAERRIQEPQLDPGRAAILDCVGFRDVGVVELRAVLQIPGLGPRQSVRLEPGSVPAGSGGGGRMSAEAADREAATSSRPCTPPQTCWFEFLLEESLLEKHLRKPCPGERGARSPRSGTRPRARPAGLRDPALSRPRACGPGGADPSRALAGPFSEQYASRCAGTAVGGPGKRSKQRFFKPTPSPRGSLLVGVSAPAKGGLGRCVG